MKATTLLFLVRDDEILLAMKKRGTGVNKWNGVGGKVGPEESVETAAIRECEEEIGVTPLHLEKVAELDFQIPTQQFHNFAHVYFCRQWQGEPTESEEMAPSWFPVAEIPYDEMWADDQHWLPRVMAGERLRGWFVFDEHEEVSTMRFEPLEP
jgi:mutator protein MutT